VTLRELCEDATRAGAANLTSQPVGIAEGALELQAEIRRLKTRAGLSGKYLACLVLRPPV